MVFLRGGRLLLDVLDGEVRTSTQRLCQCRPVYPQRLRLQEFPPRQEFLRFRKQRTANIAALARTSRLLPDGLDCRAVASFDADLQRAIADPDGLPVAIRKATLSLLGSQ
jgi:hypothetical protein